MAEVVDPNKIDLNTEDPVENAAAKVEENAANATNQIGLLNTTPIPYTSPTAQERVTGGAVTQDAAKYNTPSASVASQLNTLLGSDSEYMKQAAAKSKLTANELGMLSSDRYVGAAQGAAIREALPIATADAGTAAKFGLQQQQSENQLAATSLEMLGSGALKTQQAQIDQQAKKTSAAIDVLLQSGTAKNNIELAGVNANLNTASQEALKVLDAKISKDTMSVDYSQKTAEALRSQATSQIQNTMITIENTLKSPDILQLGSAAMAKIINNEIALMKGGIELTYNIAKLNVDGYISTLLDDFEDNYNWVTT